MPRLFSALRHRDFRLYFTGQLVSLHGTWMQQLAQAWLVYRLTESSFMLGLTAFLGTLPVLLFGLWGGVVADRLPKRRLFMTAQGIAMVQALVLAVLVLSGLIQVWHVIVLALLHGLVNAFEMPARHSFIASLVPREGLANAIALNSGVFNVSRFLAPAVAGWLVLWAGEGVVFLINALSYSAVLYAVSRMSASAGQVGERGGKPRLREGLVFAWNHRQVRAAMLLVALVAVCGTSYVVLMPVFVREVLASGANSLGMLLSSAGLGALSGALLLAYRSREEGLTHLIGIAGMVAGLGLLIFSRMEQYGLALLVLPLVGFGLTTVVAGANTFVQMNVPDRMRGRVMALYSVVFIGHTPIGNLLAGTAGEWFGAPTALLVFGGLLLVGAGIFLRGAAAYTY
jgi:MFS family permease